MINKTFAILILLFVLNCKSTQNQEKMGEQDIVLISKGNLYGSGEEGIEKQNSVITNDSDWQDLMARMNSVNKISGGFSESEIDFSKYRVVAVFDEVKSTGGHSIELDIASNSENIEVNISHKSPEGMATTVMTQPYYIVKIVKNDLPISFLSAKN
ncbi:protease complex subunit PrcB family protein [uncultured Winogradskyella sp.]|uniref:protease complex subunit PrcB family protein n=1 Tax=uncultured Winogradskyella sp. TaxID=395353 RepID=UPI002631E23E|nr:protease complex subunit PrcB family protein [uncultured Winogradskyella sp.]